MQKELRLRHQLADTGYPNLFETMESCAKKLPASVWQKLINTHKSIERNELRMFQRSQPWSSDFLTYLSLRVQKISAKDLNKQVLQDHPGDLIAKVNRFEMLLAERRPTEAEELLGGLQRQVTLQQRQEAELGLAYCMSCLPPAFVPDAVARYRAVLFQGQCLVSVQQWIFALYQLAVLYGKLLSKAVRTEYTHDYTLEYCIKMISCLLSVVIQSGDEVLVPRAWAELATSLHRFQSTCGVTVRLVNWEDYSSVDDCLEKALQLTDQDPHVLELAGRHHRATGQLDTARPLLEKAADLSPHRHVALHHLGLLHRQLWQQGLGATHHRRHGKRDQPLDVSVPLVSGVLQLVSSTAGMSSDGHSVTASIAQVWKEIDQVDQSCKAANTVGVQPRRWCRPRGGKPCRDNESNMNVVDPDSEHLQKALRCLSQANEACQHSSCRYLVDLSRIQFSLGLTSKAQSSLQKADCLLRDGEDCQFVHSTDALYLYEQWAYQLQCSESATLESIKDKYRLALECAVRAHTQPHFAYKNLKAILRQQHEKCLDTEQKERIQTEVLALDLLMGHTAAAGEELDSLPEKSQILEMQVKRFVEVGCYSAAYTYLTALLHECSGTFPEMEVAEVLEIAKEAVKGLRQSRIIYRDIVERYLAFEREGKGQSENRSTEPQNEASDLTLLATDGGHPAVNKLKTCLELSCGMQVFLGATWNYGDVPEGMHLLQYIGDRCEVGSTRGILFLAADYLQCPVLGKIVDDIIATDRKPPLCCLVSDGIDIHDLPRTVASVPRVQMPQPQDMTDEAASLRKCSWDIIETLVLEKVASCQVIDHCI